MNNQDILKNGPSGWTHHVFDNGTSCYFKIADLSTAVWSGTWEVYSDNRHSLPDLDNVRNRYDIERIAQLETLEQKNEFLGSVMNLLSNAIYNPVFSDEMAQRECLKILEKDSTLKLLIDKHNEEQQSKGADYVIETVLPDPSLIKISSASLALAAQTRISWLSTGQPLSTHFLASDFRRKTHIKFTVLLSVQKIKGLFPSIRWSLSLCTSQRARPMFR
jgi:hypothetical protein